jgi:hypothetical protein
MRTFALSVVALALVVPFAGSASAAAAKKKTVAAKAVSAPAASASELDKLKGDFKWGMSPDDVLAKMVQKIEARYEERLKKSAQDPTKYDRIQKEMRAEVEKAKQHSLVKFDGQKTGYDVSIIDQEFGHNVGESMLVAKEDQSSRYFFFVGDRLYKMFIAFDKDMLEGKSFKDFGGLMQHRFGKARDVYVDERTKAGVNHKLDHYVWSSKSGDVLRLVDRSAFYDVYCLVIYDGNIARQQAESYKAHGDPHRADALVDAITTKPINNRDENDNVMDRITGQEVHKPGEKAPADIVVPSPTQPVHAPSPSEVNKRDVTPAADDEPKEAKPSKKSKGKEKKDDNKAPPGLEL